MPIRFSCPKCKQKLSVSSRKAGTKADCPRCQETIKIPELPAPAPVAAAASSPAAAAAEPSPARVALAPPPEWPADGPPPDERREEPAASPPPAEDEPFGPGPNFGDDFREYSAFPSFEETVVIYDTDESQAPAPSSSLPDFQDLVTVPRYVLYLQGGLLAVVALASFSIGLLAGGAFGGGAASGPTQPVACTLTGTVNFVAGGRNLPDAGAAIAVIPQNRQRPDEKAPIIGLRPGDPTPDETHRGFAILRELGGAYTRTDDKGRFELHLPDRGRYLVLVISHDRKVRSLDDIRTEDILDLGPFFDNAADLLGKQRYQLTKETVRGDKQLEVLFQ